MENEVNENKGGFFDPKPEPNEPAETGNEPVNELAPNPAPTEPPKTEEGSTESGKVYDPQVAANAYRELQQKVTQLDVGLKETEERALRAELELQFFREQQQQTPEPEPVNIPTFPQVEDGYEQDPMQKATVETLQYLTKELGSMKQTAETERQERAQTKQLATEKALMLGELQKVGHTPDKAQKIYDWMQSKDSANLRWVGEAYEAFIHSDAPSQHRSTEMDKAGQRQTVPVPPSVTPTQVEPTEELGFAAQHKKNVENSKGY